MKIRDLRAAVRQRPLTLEELQWVGGKLKRNLLVVRIFFFASVLHLVSLPLSTVLHFPPIVETIKSYTMLSLVVLAFVLLAQSLVLRWLCDDHLKYWSGRGEQ
jgi:hypothetical protein